MATLTGMIRECDLARDLGLSVSALRAWRRRSYGPPAYKIGKLVAYDSGDVATFIASRRESMATRAR